MVDIVTPEQNIYVPLTTLNGWHCTCNFIFQIQQFTSSLSPFQTGTNITKVFMWHKAVYSRFMLHHRSRLAMKYIHPWSPRRPHTKRVPLFSRNRDIGLRKRVRRHMIHQGIVFLKRKFNFKILTFFPKIWLKIKFLLRHFSEW